MNQCKSCGKPFEVIAEDERYFQVHGIIAPTICHLCSWKRKLSWANEYKIYKRKCSATSKSIISVYKENAPFPVYKRDYWLEDSWKLPYLDYDKNRSFLGQYFELFKITPRPHNNCLHAENSEYGHLIFNSSNCYLSFQIFESENLLCCYRTVQLKNSASCFFCSNSELLYECSNCHRSYNLKFSEDCENCSDSAFLYDCKNCSNCFMSWNLRNKQYYFLNKKLSKEEYEKKLAEYNLAEKLNEAKNFFESQRENFIVRATHNINCEKCEGDYCVGCKNCREIYFSDDCEDSVNILRGTQDKDSYDAVAGGLFELCYNVLQCGMSYKCAFTINSNHCHDTYFSEACDNCNDCIGCISLRRGKYSILNKEYSKENYLELKKHIFDELTTSGTFEDFFDTKRSPFEYEETIADLYFHKTRNDSKNITNENNNQTNICNTCQKPFAISEAEKTFQKKMGVSATTDCFYCRILRLARPYSTVKMAKSNCTKCGAEISAPDSERKFGKLFCEKCYLREIY